MSATILVADDEPHIVEIVATVLEDEGYTVLPARDGAEALDRIEREHPDLVITDNMMPRMSGVELVAHLHARPDLAVPVILMSAATPVALPPPPTTFLPKPFDLARLLALVGELLPR